MEHGQPQSRRLRNGRHSEPQGAYLLTCNCFRRMPRLAPPQAASIVLETLYWLDTHGRIALIAAVVMPDHVHFVATLGQGTLAQAMHSLKSFSAQKINQGACRPGRLWQPGYHDHALRTDEDLPSIVAYCLRNPQRAGLVDDFRDYPHAWCKWPV